MYAGIEQLQRVFTCTGKLRKHAHVRLYAYNAFVYSSLVTFLTVFVLVLFRGVSLCSVIYTSTYYRPIRSLLHANRDVDIHYNCSACQTKIISIARLSVV